MIAICSFHKATGSVWTRNAWAGNSAIFAALTFTLAPSAFGSTSSLPAACLSYSVTASLNSGGGAQVNCSAIAGTYAQGSSSGGNATAVLSVSPTPAVSATASTAIQAVGVSASTEAVIQYYIEFSGPTATVPIQVNALASASGSESSAQLVIGNTGLSAYYLYLVASTSGGWGSVNGAPCSANTATPIGGGASCGASYAPGTVVSNNLTWIANTNVLYEVELGAVAQNNGAGTSASAYVDPTFSIASSVTDPQDYSILLSGGIGNSPASTAAPEPATIALLFSGIATAVCFRRRK